MMGFQEERENNFSPGPRETAAPRTSSELPEWKSYYYSAFLEDSREGKERNEKE